LRLLRLFAAVSCFRLEIVQEILQAYTRLPQDRLEGLGADGFVIGNGYLNAASGHPDVRANLPGDYETEALECLRRLGA
jgi:hypothetical protein